MAIGTQEAQIKAAVATARRRDATIPEGYATAAIAAGKSVAQVKADLFDRITGAGREAAKASMIKTLKSHGHTPNDAA